MKSIELNQNATKFVQKLLGNTHFNGVATAGKVGRFNHGDDIWCNGKPDQLVVTVQNPARLNRVRRIANQLGAVELNCDPTRGFSHSLLRAEFRFQ